MTLWTLALVWLLLAVVIGVIVGKVADDGKDVACRGGKNLTGHPAQRIDAHPRRIA